MSQLIEVTATQRKFQSRINWETFASSVAFDVEDLASPIRRVTGSPITYFTARALNGLNKDSRNNALIDYRVTETLAVIAGSSDHLFLATVTKVRNKILSTPEQYVFVASKVSENLTPLLGGGSTFKYIEDGYPDVIEYQVSESLATIISQLSPTAFVAVRNGLNVNSGFVELGQTINKATDPAKLIHNTEIPMNGYFLQLFGYDGSGGKTIYFKINPANVNGAGIIESPPTYVYNPVIDPLNDYIIGINANNEFYSTLLSPQLLKITEVNQDITGLNGIDLTGLYGTVIVNLTSTNATETINVISNASNVTKVILRPAVGLNVDFNDLSIGGIGANMKLKVATETVYGSKYGFLELTLRSGAFFETAYIDQYV